MLTLTTLDILYITLSIFTAVVGTLLSITLFRIIKIMGPILEILEYYKKIKSYISTYAEIPEIVRNKVFEVVNSIGKNNKDEEIKKED